jgi:hypothetical protein
MTYLNGARLSPTVRLSVSGAPPERGDELALEYPNRSTESATVVSCSVDSLVIAVGDAQWRENSDDLGDFGVVNSRLCRCSVEFPERVAFRGVSSSVTGAHMSWNQFERIHKLRQRSEELRKVASQMSFRASRADVMAVAVSYDRLADSLDAVAPTEPNDSLSDLLRKPH